MRIYENKNAPAAARMQVITKSAEAKLVDLGKQIFEGRAAADPYKKGAKVACEECDYQSICRIDPWAHSFRSLKKSDSPAKSEPEPKEGAP